MGCGASHEGSTSQPSGQVSSNAGAGAGASAGASANAPHKSKSAAPEDRIPPPHDSYSAWERPGGQFSANEAYKGALVPPTNAPTLNQSQPDQNLKIDYVFGYKNTDARANCRYSSNFDEIVYHAGAIGIVTSISSNKQRYLGGGEKTSHQGHLDDIMSLAVSADRKSAVSGECGKNPQICIWDIASGSLKAKFNQGKNTRLIKSSAFSPDGRFIATLADDNDHTIYVWDASSGSGVCNFKSGQDPIQQIVFQPSQDGYIIASAGKRVSFFMLDGNGNFQEEKKGIFGSEKMADMNTIAILSNGCAITGATTGGVYLWEDKNCKKVINVDKGAIGAVASAPGFIAVSTKEEVIVYNEDFAETTRYQTGSFSRSLDINPSNGNVLSATRDGRILELAGGNLNLISQTHSDGETWGLAVCPKTGLVVTSGDDNRLISYDMSSNKVVSTAVLNEKKGPERKAGYGASSTSDCPPNQNARALAINGVTGQVAFATCDGEVQIRTSAQDLSTPIGSYKESKEWIEVLSYSPCGNYLAIGGHDCKIYVLDTQTYGKVSVFAKHSAFITGLDWSADSQYIQSVSASYEILFQEALTGKHKPEGATELRDQQWATWTCRLGWPVQGLFPSGVEGCHIHGVARNSGSNLIATGDEWKLVNLQRFPNGECTKPKSYVGHSEFVTRVAWSIDDKYLYSVGGEDRALIKWKVC